jgi:hypothetical protein
MFIRISELADELGIAWMSAMTRLWTSTAI